MRIMAIDYGDAHTGIAISDPTGLLAGFTTVINAYRPDRVTEQIALLAKEHRVERLVLGHPINMDGTRGPRSEKAQAMRQLLEETDTLVDGRFILAQRDLTLIYKGSRNQRIIDMNRTRAEGKLVLDPVEEENLRPEE